MASDDSSLIGEVRGLTDYGTEIFTDSEIQDLVDIGKEELRAEVGDPDLAFYEADTFQATRALFWFVCIASKVRAGEIAGIDITVDDIEASDPGGSPYEYYFRNFSKRLQSATSSQSAGPASRNISRTNRSYGDN